jgi:hypothetical protein
MMSVGKQIKVIKRAGQRKSRPHNIEETQSVAAASRSAAEAERTAVTIVTHWVNELRRKKGEEAKRARQSLFHQTA